MAKRKRRADEYAGGDPRFAEWLNTVDQMVVQTAGLSMFDFPDALWRDHFDDGLSPRDAIETVAENDGGAWAQVWAFMEGDEAHG